MSGRTWSEYIGPGISVPDEARLSLHRRGARMAKKMSMLLAAVALIAVAVPAAVRANTPTLFDHTGKVEVNAKILGTSTNTVTLTSQGNLKCAKTTLTWKVTNNASGTVRGVGEGSGIGTTCDLGGNPIALGDITLSEIHTASAGSG